MTDTSSFLSNKQVVDDRMSYGVKPSHVRARQYPMSCESLNKSSFLPGTTANFKISCGRANTHMNCQQTGLKLTVANTHATEALVLDGSAYSLIDSISVSCGGAVLEQELEMGPL